jgi:signal transduction histidine kinase
MATKLPAAGPLRIGLRGDLWVAARDDDRARGLLLTDDPRSSLRRTLAAFRTDTLRGVKSLRLPTRALDSFRADVLLAALFVAAGVIELALVDPEGHDRPITFVAGAVALSSVALRRRDPLIAGVLFTVPSLIQAAFDGYLTSSTTVPFVAVILLFYSTGRYASGRHFWPALAVILVGMLATLAVESGSFSADDLLWAALLFGLPALAGRALRSRALLQAELREKAERAEAERAERARSAVEEERARIAAELQAIVANGVSAMVVQAEAVPRAIAARDSVRAGTALAAVEETGRDALTEMRRLLGVLRRDGDGPELAPQPGLGRLQGLVERVCERGLDVALQVEGEQRPLAPGVDLTAYRVLEDALNAATEREASEASVIVRYGARELELEVHDDRSGGASERLPGLRDRVGLYGGHLRAGRPESGGFRLKARLPVEASD